MLLGTLCTHSASCFVHHLCKCCVLSVICLRSCSMFCIIWGALCMYSSVFCVQPCARLEWLDWGERKYLRLWWTSQPPVSLHRHQLLPLQPPHLPWQAGLQGSLSVCALCVCVCVCVCAHAYCVWVYLRVCVCVCVWWLFHSREICVSLLQIIFSTGSSPLAASRSSQSVGQAQEACIVSSFCCGQFSHIFFVVCF